MGQVNLVQCLKGGRQKTFHLQLISSIIEFLITHEMFTCAVARVRSNIEAQYSRPVRHERDLRWRRDLTNTIQTRYKRMAFIREHFPGRNALVDLRTRFGNKRMIKERITYRNSWESGGEESQVLYLHVIS